MNRNIAFVELEQHVEQLVNRYTRLKDENDALKREVGFLRQENQKLQSEHKDIEDKISRILHRVQMQGGAASDYLGELSKGSSDDDDDDDIDANRYEDLS